MKLESHLAVGGMLLALLATTTVSVAQPVITNQPTDQIGIARATATFSVGATGTPPLTYQWRRHTNALGIATLTGETNSSLLLTNVQPTARRFGVIVTDGSGLSVTSILARLTVVSPPSIATEPSSHSTVTGESATLSVVAGGTAPMAYQWSFNGQPISGPTSSNLIFASVQFSNAGAYQVVITNLFGAATSRVATLTVESATLFTRITTGPIATDTGHSFACAWADFNGDDWIDLLVANEYYPEGGQFEKTMLYVNQGDGTFVRATTAVTTTGGSTLGIACADFDNDGSLDIFFANIRLQTSFLFRATGHGDFVRITDQPVVRDGGQFHGGAWGDFDNDGLVDLFVAAFRPITALSAPNVLYQNLGAGQFQPVEFDPLAPTNRTTSSTSVTWCDFDNDGDLDIFLTNGGWVAGQNNEPYRNDGHGVFTKLTNAVPAKDGGNSESSTWGDFDNDGFPDLFVANITGLGGPKNFLYHNQGDGTFARILSGDIVNEPSGINSIGCAWADYDNDGWLDLFVANGESSSQVHFLYHNSGGGTFTKIRSGIVTTESGASDGCAWGDYDNDGFLDLFVSNFNDGASTPLRNMLYHNNGNSNAWLNFRLVGTVSNRSAIGAKVRLKAKIRGQTFWQMREISGGSGFGSQNDMRANFGLGDATNADLVRIEWPSGIVQNFTNLAAKQFLTITEPPRLSATKVSGLPQFTLKGGRNMSYDIESSIDLNGWLHFTNLTITNVAGTALITNPVQPIEAQQFYRALVR